MKSICLLSGGLDSLVSLSFAKKETDVILALTFDYGQKAFKNEKDSAQKIAQHYNIPHKIIRLEWLKQITNTSLVNKSAKIPSYDKIDLSSRPEVFIKNVALVWVPNRNGVFVNIAASFAEAYSADLIVCGFNSEEAANFSDNSIQFVNSINSALKFSTLSRPRVISYVQSYQKSGIVKAGIRMNSPLHLIYSCYKKSSNQKMCGVCESCIRLKRAFRQANAFEMIKDRFKYAD